MLPKKPERHWSGSAIGAGAPLERERHRSVGSFVTNTEYLACLQKRSGNRSGSGDGTATGEPQYVILASQKGSLDSEVFDFTRFCYKSCGFSLNSRFPFIVIS